jgi:hypothetical protein
MATAQAVVREHQEYYLQVFLKMVRIFFRIHYTDKKENKMATAQAVVREHQEHNLQVFFKLCEYFFRIHYTDKKEHKIFSSYIGKFTVARLQSLIYMRSPSYMTLQPLHSEFPYTLYEENLFSFLSV